MWPEKDLLRIAVGRAMLDAKFHLSVEESPNAAGRTRSLPGRLREYTP
jgi:hypothetical protein